MIKRSSRKTCYYYQRIKQGVLQNFFRTNNSMHPTINFTAEWLYRSASFLAVKIILNKEGHLTTDLSTKPTDTHQYLHQQSCDQHHCKATITDSQALRLWRICSLDEDYLWRVEELKSHLVNQGHGEMEIQRQIDRANRVSRDQALETSGTKTTDRIPLVVPYHHSVKFFVTIFPFSMSQKERSWQHRALF